MSVLSAAWSPDGRRIVSASSDGTARVWDVTRTEALRQDRAVVLTTALTRGLGLRTESEASDLLLQEAPEDLYDAAFARLTPEQQAQVPDVAAALRAPLHPNCYLSPTQFAEKFGLPLPEKASENASGDAGADAPAASAAIEPPGEAAPVAAAPSVDELLTAAPQDAPSPPPVEGSKVRSRIWLPWRKR
jgi:hypothetical protein